MAAAKRFHEESSSTSDDPEHPEEKRTRGKSALIMPQFGDAFLLNFCTTFEPMIRKVVSEEVENGIGRIRGLTKSPSVRIQALEPPPTLRLVFGQKLALPIFTGNKIVSADGNHLQLLLMEDQKFRTTLPAQSLKVEIVVLDGDFPGGERDDWSGEEFSKSIVRERTGKRPLLAGDLFSTMRGGVAMVGDLGLTDNSSWIRSRHFRLGARIVVSADHSSNGVIRIREAITEAFMVKDHRGELYKKHYPPRLQDEVWRLEKISKDGAFHRKLSSMNINSVQDFLKLSVVDSARLQNMLGVGMSDRMWEATMKHARTCSIENKMYIYRGSHFSVTLNPICMVVRANIHGQTYATTQELSSIRSYLEELVKQAYANWDSLEVVEGVQNETPLLTQGEDIVEQYGNHEATMAIPFQQLGDRADTASIGVGYADVVGSSHWQMNSSYHHAMPYDASSLPCYTIQDSSTEGDGTSSSGPSPNGC